MYMMEQNWNETMLYATLAIGSVSNASKSPFMSLLLGLGIQLTTDGIGQWEKLYRAKYYLEIGVKTNFGEPVLSKFQSLGYLPYAYVLEHLGFMEYDGWPHQIPGHSFLPKVLYWASKAGKLNFISQDKRPEYAHCSHCNCKTPVGKMFKHCAKCSAAWCEYC